MIDDIISIFLRSSSIIMDGYVLSRILRDKFEMELESEKYRLNQEKYGKEHIYIKNIIIYAGESHCNNYREFLDYTKEFNRENISIHEKDNINQCIEINDPLFE